MALLTTLSFIASHPLNQPRKLAALLGYVKWQVGSRLVPGDTAFEWIGGARLLVRRGEEGVTGNIYTGLHEFADMAYVLHAVRAEDLFVDVGANVGSYSVLACAVRGARGYCFEPVPATYRRLVDNLRLNDLLDRVIPLNIGIGDQEAELKFTAGENCMNHVVSAGESAAATVAVSVRTLDSVLAGSRPAVMKIDVEGFEQPVLRGAAQTLGDATLHSVVMELNGSGMRYGFSDEELVACMRGHGFIPHEYQPLSRTLQPIAISGATTGNVLFVRDVERVRRLLESAPTIAVGSVEL